jgi:excisionase family DNA binding protein
LFRLCSKTGSIVRLTEDTFDLNEPDRRALSSITPGTELRITTVIDEQEIRLPDAAQKAVNRLLHNLAEGLLNADGPHLRSASSPARTSFPTGKPDRGLPVHLLTSKHELSTQQAADLLGLSRTYVAQLIDQGTLPAFHVGTHRRLRANDAIAYKQHPETRLNSLQAITAADNTLGLTY